ncbi:L-alanine-DL-glutamate epimerase-like enolase superfamily enzyme [Friedmanniella endophytica]|uniref:L-alanine-DL-glutamate epimerase-like enolase superfamily enzyme n=1 Tax=Microlunatus kandeliicorticis TaxID=1759536 RepID=A0A7W3IPR3_9ACTN|nr:mandelate racemase/muconate lactonizing enzyme family protein [Microlunatus kandeliicorticis]MBA8792996.1 L-alanine-DL-glutamate epimerase-like enolase superfamily enzyme [Microlunatus kandeliicorticis]
MNQPGPSAAPDGDPIERARAWLVDLPVERLRTDAVQQFVKQETIFVEVITRSGVQGLGYAYTIGTGGTAVLALLRDTLLEQVIGADVHRVEDVWRRCFTITRATTTGVITALALAAVDTAVWDARSRACGVPLWRLAGGAQPDIAVYDTEGGWLHLPVPELVEQALASRERGLGGVKIKIGKPKGWEDAERLRAVREAVGPDFDLMVDANQSMTAAEAIRRARLFEPLDLFWLEEPLPADDLDGHVRLAASTSIPVAVGESMYAPLQFRGYLQAGAASIVQVDVARVGGITPWLKVAHLAETFNVQVAPHFLMELHLPLVCAIPNGLYLEHIPQLRAITTEGLDVTGGRVRPSEEPGLGIAWDEEKLRALTVA